MNSRRATERECNTGATNAPVELQFARCALQSALTGFVRAGTVDSSFVAIGRHSSIAMSHRMEPLQANAPQKRRHEAHNLRNGWLSVAAGMKTLETA
jgi:hypothetical protein